MKKILVLFILGTLLCIHMTAQEHGYVISYKPFNSVFSEKKSGRYIGTVNGLLRIKDGDKRVLLDFQGSKANLKLTPENYEGGYDVSFKKYTGYTTSGKTTVIYETYARANVLTIISNKNEYSVGIIDGACDYVIDGLDYEYEVEKSAEYLILRVWKEIILQSTGGKKIRLLPDSSITFAIKRF